MTFPMTLKIEYRSEMSTHNLGNDELECPKVENIVIYIRIGNFVLNKCVYLWCAFSIMVESVGLDAIAVV